MESHLRVEIVPRTPSGYLARVNDAEFPILGLAMLQSEGGMVISLVLAPDSVRIGERSASEPAPETSPAGPPVRAWGDPAHSDPREGIPGWTPEGLGPQVAVHAEMRHGGTAAVAL